MATVELEHHGAAPGQTSDVRRPETDRFDERCERVGKARQLEALRQVRGPAGPRLVPCHNRELVGQSGDLRLPDAAVIGRTVDKDQRRPGTDSLVGDLEPARLHRLHERNVRVKRTAPTRN